MLLTSSASSKKQGRLVSISFLKLYETGSGTNVKALRRYVYGYEEIACQVFLADSRPV